MNKAEYHRTKIQDENATLEEQRTAVKALAESLGYIVIDPEETPASAMEKMLRDVQEGKIHIL